MDNLPFGLGAKESKKDIRTFAYAPSSTRQKGGTRYAPEDIEHQHKVGICTAISLTQNARKALGRKFSADFHYLMQKIEYDKNWDEGSSILNSLKTAKNIGLLPEEEFSPKWITEADRLGSYDNYIRKLKRVPKSEIERLKGIAAAYKIKAYASVPVDRDMLANAIDESESGILVRFEVGKEWYTEPIEPLRPPIQSISGHAITECNYDGGSFRVANTWGKDWADKGTAYFLLSQYQPTEAWIVYYEDTPPHVDEQLRKREELLGKAIDIAQKILELLRKK